MRAPNGEAAYDVTAPMLEALHALIDAEPHSQTIASIKTAVALLNRAWVTRASQGYPLASDDTYYITKAGRTAYGIARRATGVL
jgi:hypothetical protein